MPTEGLLLHDHLLIIDKLNRFVQNNNLKTVRGRTHRARRANLPSSSPNVRMSDKWVEWYNLIVTQLSGERSVLLQHINAFDLFHVHWEAPFHFPSTAEITLVCVYQILVK